MILGLVGGIVSILYSILFAIKKNKDKRTKGILSVILSAILIIVGGVMLDSSSTTNNKVETKDNKSNQTKTEEPKNETLADLVAKNLKGSKVTSEGKTLTIEFKGGTLSENTFVELGLNDTRKCFKEVYKNEQFKQFDVIKVNVMCELTDQYGKTNSAVGMSLTFDQSELEKVEDFDKITINQLVVLQGNNKTGVTGAIRKGLSQENIKMLYPNQ